MVAPPPPPPMAKPDGGDVNRAAGLIAIYWAEMFVAITIVSLRMYARKITKNYGWDDWMMLITLVRFPLLHYLVQRNGWY